MKADIPDKILINRGEDGKLHHSYWTTDQELVPFEDTIYICKDALLEWLLKGIEMSEICHSEYGDACAQAYQAVIDKLNSM